MHSHQLRNTNLGIGAGFLLQLVGLVAVNTGDATGLLGVAFEADRAGGHDCLGNHCLYDVREVVASHRTRVVSMLI